jgi:hypothetical protein
MISSEMGVQSRESSLVMNKILTFLAGNSNYMKVFDKIESKIRFEDLFPFIKIYSIDKL